MVLRNYSICRFASVNENQRKIHFILSYFYTDALHVSRGQVTFNSEGNDNKNSRYFSRKAHVPSSSSGITLGRGYDLSKRESDDVYRDLVKAGVNKDLARKFSGGAGKSGNAAKNYLKVFY